MHDGLDSEITKDRKTMVWHLGGSVSGAEAPFLKKSAFVLLPKFVDFRGKMVGIAVLPLGQELGKFP